MMMQKAIMIGYLRTWGSGIDDTSRWRAVCCGHISSRSRSICCCGNICCRGGSICGSRSICCSGCCDICLRLQTRVHSLFNSHFCKRFNIKGAIVVVYLCIILLWLIIIFATTKTLTYLHFLWWSAKEN